MGFVKYIKESFEELTTNMTWISKEEAQKSTVIVATFTIAFAIVIASIDWVFKLGLDKYFE